MAWMMDTYSVNTGHTVLGVVTGKPISLGGSLGRASSTSRGVVHVALEALTHLGIAHDGATAAVQGFGKVGRGTARFLAEAGVRVEAVADQYGAIRAPGGIELAALETYVDETGTVVGFDGASPIDAEDLLELDVDLLVPAAVEGVLHAGNADRVRARLVVEGANGPTTPEADDDPRRAAASPSCPTSWPTPAASSCPTSSGFRPTRRTGGPRTRSRPGWPIG